jgi:glutamate decarboxylase
MLHPLKPGPAREADEGYASAAAAKLPPKHRIPDRETFPFDAYQLVHDELGLDGNARLNLATFCQTWVEPQVHDLMNECIDKNIVDKDEYPQTAELEAGRMHCSRLLLHQYTAGTYISFGIGARE